MSVADLKTIKSISNVSDREHFSALLRDILAELRGLREDMARRDPTCQRNGEATAAAPLSLSRADRALLARLLPVIGGALGSESFLARDLFEHESAALRLVLRGLNAKRIGRLFQRAAGGVLDGYMVERAGDELHTNLWRVMEVPGSGLPASPPQAPRGLVK